MTPASGALPDFDEAVVRMLPLNADELVEVKGVAVLPPLQILREERER